MAVTQIKDASSDAQLKVNSDGSINVNATGGGGTTSNVSIVEAGNTAVVTPSGSLQVVMENAPTVSSDVAGLDSFATSQYTVGTTAIQLTPSPLTDRSSVSIRVMADSGAIVYIGSDNTVTTSTGYPLFNGDTIQMDLTPADQIWAIANVANQDVAVLEMA